MITPRRMVGVVVVAFLSLPAVAADVPAASQPADPFAASKEPARSGETSAEPAPGEKRPPREPEKVSDLSPELATHEETDSLKVEFRRLTALRLRPDGSLLACDADARHIKIILADGRQDGVMPLEFPPEALALADDGTIYCGGQGRLAKLDATGRVLKVVTVPEDVVPVEAKEPEEASPEKESTAAAPRRKKAYPKQISGIAVSPTDVFAAFGSEWSVGSKSKLYRFDRDLESPRLLAEGLRGCCQRCDIVVRDGVLYVAENAAHRVVLYDREGNVQGKWGELGRDKLEAFGACCNPMNICFDGSGLLYTAESGLGRVKRYTRDGQFVDLVGYVGTDRFWSRSGFASSCSNIAIAATADGSKVFVMDFRNHRIRVLQQKNTSPGTGN